jgi:HisJ family histidinol phosphate phosphatase
MNSQEQAILMDMHNHSQWSDGANTLQEMVENAIKQGVTHFAITDHLKTSKCPSVNVVDLTAYIAEIRLVAEHYREKIMVFAGIEVNAATFAEINRPETFVALSQLDFVLWEYVDQRKTSLRLTELPELMKNVGIPYGLAHTSLLKLAEKYTDMGGLDFVLNFMAENRIFWEINVNEGYRYAAHLMSDNADSIEEITHFIEKLRTCPIPITIGTDCHSLEYQYNTERTLMHEWTRKQGLWHFVP